MITGRRRQPLFLGNLPKVYLLNIGNSYTIFNWARNDNLSLPSDSRGIRLNFARKSLSTGTAQTRPRDGTTRQPGCREK